jgi:colanic acid/amylovoran biosynthesis glycosyltransferase
LTAVFALVTRLHHSARRGRLAVERSAASLLASVRGQSKPRVLATACWRFPIYSQSFVYQELAALAQSGVALRFLYSELARDTPLPAAFAPVWKGRRPHVPTVPTDEADLRHFRKLLPERVEGLTMQIANASGLSRAEVEAHEHFRQAFGFARLVEAYRPDYLHSYFFYERTLFTLVASQLLDIPRGVSCYADHQLRDYPLKVVALHLRTCDLVIATSRRIAGELQAIEPALDPARVLVKPNGVATDRFPVSRRRESVPDGSPLRLASVSRIAEKKGLLYLVDAVTELRRRGIAVELVIGGAADDDAGSMAYANALEARAAAPELDGAVRLVGRLDHAGMLQVLDWADVFVAPYVETEHGDKDGIPTALLEAMATGISVVATDAGSITEVLRDQESGLLVPQRDPLALADALLRLRRDDAQRIRLGGAAARVARERFDVGSSEPAFHARVRSILRMRAAARAAGSRTP